MIQKGLTASISIAAALLISAPLSAANRHDSAAHHQQYAKVALPGAKQTRRSSNPDAQRTDAVQPIAQPNRGLIVGVGPPAMVRLPEFRDIAMAPTG